MRQVSKSSLSHVSERVPAATVKSLTHRAKLLISYAPGVHAGSESSTGSLPSAVNVVTTRTTRSVAVARVNVTSYRMPLTAAETGARAAAAMELCAAITRAPITMAPSTLDQRDISDSIM